MSLRNGEIEKVTVSLELCSTAGENCKARFSSCSSHKPGVGQWRQAYIQISFRMEIEWVRPAESFWEKALELNPRSRRKGDLPPQSTFLESSWILLWEK